MAKGPSRIDLLELDIDLRLTDLWREAADVGEWNLEIVAAFMRAAYGKGYCDALTEDEPGSLCHEHGYRIPGRRPAPTREASYASRLHFRRGASPCQPIPPRHRAWRGLDARDLPDLHGDRGGNAAGPSEPASGPPRAGCARRQGRRPRHRRRAGRRPALPHARRQG